MEEIVQVLDYNLLFKIGIIRGLILGLSVILMAYGIRYSIKLFKI